MSENISKDFIEGKRKFSIVSLENYTNKKLTSYEILIFNFAFAHGLDAVNEYNRIMDKVFK